MSLQLHRPDGEGGLEPRPVPEPELARPAPLAALGRGLRGRPPAGPQEPGDEPDLASCARSLFWLGLGVADVRAARRRLRDGLLELATRAGTARRREPRRPGSGATPPILHRPMRFLTRFVDSNDRELRRIQPLVDATNALEAEIEALSDDEIRAALRRAPRRDPRGGRARRAVRGRAPPPRPRAPPRARRRSAASARTTGSRRPSTRSCPRSSRWPARR